MACCEPLYYCTPDGPLAVEADVDGWYEPPTGFTAGPFETYWEALDCCAPEPITLTCGDDVWTIDGSVTLNFTDLDAGLFASWGFNSIVIPLTHTPGVGVGGNVYWAQLGGEFGQCPWTASFQATCTESGLLVSVAVTAAYGPDNQPVGFGCPSTTTYFFSSRFSPWGDGGLPYGATKTLTGGGPIITAPESVGDTGAYTLVLT